MLTKPESAPWGVGTSQSKHLGGFESAFSSFLLTWAECWGEASTKPSLVDKGNNVDAHEKFRPNYTLHVSGHCEIACPGCSSC